MARELSDIIKELDTVYNPLKQAARDEYNKEVPLVEADLQAQEQGLQRAKENAFGDIDTRANRRGMFFSGIPLKEQAQYVGSDFLPAVASLKNRYFSKKNSLYDAMMRAITGYDAEASNKAMGIRQNELALDEERRQFEARMAFEREQAARAAAGGGGAGGISPSLGFTGTGGGSPTVSSQQATMGKINVMGASPLILQQAYNDVQTRVNSNDANAIRSDYQATATSAMNGNLRDLAKLQIYRALRPDLFKTAYQWEGTAINKANNVGQGVLAPTAFSAPKTTPTSNLLKPFGF